MASSLQREWQTSSNAQEVQKRDNSVRKVERKRWEKMGLFAEAFLDCRGILNSKICEISRPRLMKSNSLLKVEIENLQEV